MRLRDKIALITGSTRGVGEDVAYRFAEQGAKVAVTGRDDEKGKQVVEAIKAGGGTAMFVRADLSREADVENLVSEVVGEFGGLHVLVNNAAATDLMATSTKPLGDNTTEEFDAIVKVALYGTFWTTKYALPHLIAAGGASIINVSSMASIQGFPAVPAYTAAKGGVNALTRQLAYDYGPHGIRVNTIIIGVVINELTKGVISTPSLRDAFYKLHMTPRVGECSDVSNLAIYLASDESTFMTACELRMDGGSTMRGPLIAEMVDVGIQAER